MSTPLWRQVIEGTFDPFSSSFDRRRSSGGSFEGLDTDWRAYRLEQDAARASESDLQRQEREALELRGQEYVNLNQAQGRLESAVGVAGALGQPGIEPKGPPPALEGIANVLDAAKSAVVGGLSGLMGWDIQGETVDQTKFAVSRFTRQEDLVGDRNRLQVAWERALKGFFGGQSYGFGDFEVLRYEQDDPRYQRVTKGLGAFVLDVAFDPLTYYSFGSSILGRVVASTGVRAASRRVAREVLEQAGDEVVRAQVERLSGRELIARVSAATGRSSDELLVRTPQQLVDDLFAAKGDHFINAAADSWSFGNAAAYGARGRTGLYDRLVETVGTDLADNVWKTLPPDLRGGARFRVPFKRDVDEFTGMRVPSVISMPGSAPGRGFDLLGMDKVVRRMNEARLVLRTGPFKFLENVSGGRGKSWTNLLNAARKGDAEAIEAYALHFGSMAFDDQYRIFTAMFDQTAHAGFQAIKRQIAAAAERGLDEDEILDFASKAYFMRGRPDMPLPSAPEHVVAMDAVSHLFEMTDNTHRLAVEIYGEDAANKLQDYATRMLTPEGFQDLADRYGRLEGRRRRLASGAGRLNSSFPKSMDIDKNGNLIVTAWMTPDEIFERTGRELFMDDPFEAVAEYMNMMRRELSRDWAMKQLQDMGLLMSVGEDVLRQPTVRKIQSEVQTRMVKVRDMLNRLERGERIPEAMEAQLEAERAGLEVTLRAAELVEVEPGFFRSTDGLVEVRRDRSGGWMASVEGEPVTRPTVDQTQLEGIALSDGPTYSRDVPSDAPPSPGFRQMSPTWEPWLASGSDADVEYVHKILLNRIAVHEAGGSSVNRRSYLSFKRDLEILEDMHPRLRGIVYDHAAVPASSVNPNARFRIEVGPTGNWIMVENVPTTAQVSGITDRIVTLTDGTRYEIAQDPNVPGTWAAATLDIGTGLPVVVARNSSRDEVIADLVSRFGQVGTEGVSTPSVRATLRTGGGAPEFRNYEILLREAKEAIRRSDISWSKSGKVHMAYWNDFEISLTSTGNQQYQVKIVGPDGSTLEDFQVLMPLSNAKFNALDQYLPAASVKFSSPAADLLPSPGMRRSVEEVIQAIEANPISKWEKFGSGSGQRHMTYWSDEDGLWSVSVSPAEGTTSIGKNTTWEISINPPGGANIERTFTGSIAAVREFAAGSALPEAVAGWSPRELAPRPSSMPEVRSRVEEFLDFLSRTFEDAELDGGAGLTYTEATLQNSSFLRRAIKSIGEELARSAEDADQASFAAAVEALESIDSATRSRLLALLRRTGDFDLIEDEVERVYRLSQATLDLLEEKSMEFFEYPEALVLYERYKQATTVAGKRWSTDGPHYFEPAPEVADLYRTTRAIVDRVTERIRAEQPPEVWIDDLRIAIGNAIDIGDTDPLSGYASLWWMGPRDILSLFSNYVDAADSIIEVGEMIAVLRRASATIGSQASTPSAVPLGAVPDLRPGMTRQEVDDALRRFIYPRNEEGRVEPIVTWSREGEVDTTTLFGYKIEKSIIKRPRDRWGSNTYEIRITSPEGDVVKTNTWMTGDSEAKGMAISDLMGFLEDQPVEDLIRFFSGGRASDLSPVPAPAAPAAVAPDPIQPGLRREFAGRYKYTRPDGEQLDIVQVRPEGKAQVWRVTDAEGVDLGDFARREDAVAFIEGRPATPRRPAIAPEYRALVVEIRRAMADLSDAEDRMMQILGPENVTNVGRGQLDELMEEIAELNRFLLNSVELLAFDNAALARRIISSRPAGESTQRGISSDLAALLSDTIEDVASRAPQPTQAPTAPISPQYFGTQKYFSFDENAIPAPDTRLGFADRDEAAYWANRVANRVRDPKARVVRDEVWESNRAALIEKFRNDYEWLTAALSDGHLLRDQTAEDFDTWVERVITFLHGVDPSIDPFDNAVDKSRYSAAARAAGLEQFNTRDLDPVVAAIIKSNDLYGPEILAETIKRHFALSRDLDGAEQFFQNYWRPYYTASKSWMTQGRGYGYTARNIIGSMYNAWLADVGARHFNQSASMLAARRKARDAANEILERRPVQEGETTVEAWERIFYGELKVALREGGNGFPAMSEKNAEYVVDAYRLFMERNYGGRTARSRTWGELLDRGTLDVPRYGTEGVGRRVSELYGGKYVDELTPVQKALNASVDNAWMRHVTRVNESSEDYLRFAAFLRGADTYGLDDGGFAAGTWVVGTQFDYADLSQFERRVMKNIVPFYTWTRRNVPLQIRSVWMEPGKVNKLLKFHEEVMKAWTGEDKEGQTALPEWLRRRGGWMTSMSAPGQDPESILGRVFGLKEDPIAAFIESPLTDLGMLFNATLSPLQLMNRDEIINNLNPLLGKAAFELATGRSYTSGRELDTDALAPRWAVPWAAVRGRRNEDGELLFSQKWAQFFRNVLPPFAQAERLLAPLVGDERMRRRWLTTMGSQLLAAPLYTVDPNQQAFAINNYSQGINEALKAGIFSFEDKRDVARRLLDMGYEPAQIAQLGLSELDPGALNFEELQRARRNVGTEEQISMFLETLPPDVARMFIFRRGFRGMTGAEAVEAWENRKPINELGSLFLPEVDSAFADWFGRMSESDKLGFVFKYGYGPFRGAEAVQQWSSRGGLPNRPPGLGSADFLS